MTTQSMETGNMREAQTSRGPSPLFFSGGTALGPVASALSQYTPDAVHVITTFDSGGSSAALRAAFGMPAVGDVRARIMALSDPGRAGQADVMRLLGHRLPGTPSVLCCCAANAPAEKKCGPDELVATLRAMASGEHALVKALCAHDRAWACERLCAFLEQMPDSLDLAGASIGNLILTAEYLDCGRKLQEAARRLAEKAGARGRVLPVTEDEAHLCVRLVNGEQIVGQHRFTGKSADRITSPIEELWLSASLGDPRPIALRASAELGETIRRADLICYPVGSFFSSVLANLLPEGVSEAVRAAPCCKVFIPNLGNDPELLGHSVRAQASFLLNRLVPGMDSVGGTGAPEQASWQAESALTTLLIDDDESRYPGGIPHAWLHRLGIRVVKARLVTPRSSPYLDAELVCRQLMALL